MFIKKRPSEIFYRYHQFRRDDNFGWLEDDEVLSVANIQVFDRLGRDVTNEIIDNVSIKDDTKVYYRMKNGILGMSYFIKINVTTSKNNVFEDTLKLYVN